MAYHRNALSLHRAHAVARARAAAQNIYLRRGAAISIGDAGIARDNAASRAPSATRCAPLATTRIAITTTL